MLTGQPCVEVRCLDPNTRNINNLLPPFFHLHLSLTIIPQQLRTLKLCEKHRINMADPHTVNLIDIDIPEILTPAVAPEVASSALEKKLDAVLKQNLEILEYLKREASSFHAKVRLELMHLRFEKSELEDEIAGPLRDALHSLTLERRVEALHAVSMAPLVN